MDAKQAVASAIVISLWLGGATRANEHSQVEFADHFSVSLVASLPIDALPNAMSLGPDGEHLAVEGEDGIQFWSLPDRKPSKLFEGYGGRNSVFVSDHPCYVVASGLKAALSLDVLDCDGSTQAAATVPGGRFDRIAVSSSCGFAIAQSSDRVRVFDFAARRSALSMSKLGQRFPAKVDMVAAGSIAGRCVAYAVVSSPNGKVPAAIFAIDLKAPTAAKEVVRLAPTGDLSAPWFSPYSAIAVSPNGNLLAMRASRKRPLPRIAASWDTIEIIDTATRAVLRTLRMESQSTPVDLIAFLDDDRLIFVTGKGVFLLDSLSGQPREITFPKSERFQFPVLIDSAPAAHRLAVAGIGEIRVYDYTEPGD